MRGVNKVILIGNLGQAPERVATRSGNEVAQFSVATNERWTDGSGQRQERTEWHSIVAFGKLAEISMAYLKRGTKIYMEGQLRTQKWEDEQGNKRSRTSITLQELLILDPKDENSGRGQQQSYSEPPPSESTDPFDDDIPF